MERLTLTYHAPVYVTVNLTTKDVERVYLDDEAVVPIGEEITLEMAYDGDTDRVLTAADMAEITSALAIADGVDWTSTENRCIVWRGAQGGPASLMATVLRALDQLPADDSEVIAAKRYLADVNRWVDEGNPAL